MSNLETPEGLSEHYQSLFKYNPDQPRDEKGRWTAAGKEGIEARNTTGEKVSKERGIPFTHTQYPVRFAEEGDLKIVDKLTGLSSDNKDTHIVSVTPAAHGEYRVKHQRTHKTLNAGIRTDVLTSKTFKSKNNALKFAHEAISRGLDS